MGAGLLVDVGNEVTLAAATLVCNSILAAGGEVLDGRVGCNSVLLSCSFAIGGIGIDLGDDNVRFADEVVGENVPSRGELLAI